MEAIKHESHDCEETITKNMYFRKGIAENHVHYDCQVLSTEPFMLDCQTKGFLKSNLGCFANQ